jgi:hypothetical protein
LTTSDGGALRLDLSDGLHTAGWDCDPGLLQPNKPHHVVFIVDGGPKVISAVVDGVLCDGGENPQRKYGYGRFVMAQYADKLSDKINNPGVEEIGDVTGGKVLRIAPSLKGQVRGLRIYDRYLRTSEVVGNFHAGL